MKPGHLLQTAFLALTLLLAASDVEGRVASAIEWFEAEVEREDVLLGGYEEQAIQVRRGKKIKHFNCLTVASVILVDASEVNRSVI